MRLKVQLTRRVFFTLAGFVAVANAGVLLLPEAFGAKQGEKREVLRVASSQEFDNLNPLIGTMSAATYAHALFDRSQLTILNAENQWVAQAAERIPTVENGEVVFVKENGSEKMKVSWRIRKEAKWGDGKPLIGADYKFAWEVGRSASVSVPAKEPFDSIESIEIDASDAKRFTMTFKERKWDYYMLDAIHALPVHIEGKVFEKHGGAVEGYDRNTGYLKDFKNPGLYTGPYRVVDVQLGSHIEFEVNDNWWGLKKPQIKKIVLRVIPDTGTLESNLVSGSVDMVASSAPMTFDQAVAFEARVLKEKLPFEVKFVDGLVYEHIDLNLDNPLLADVRTRQALLLGIDRETMVQSFFAGRQKVAKHFVHPIDPRYTDDPEVISSYPYSPRKARKLLEEVGFKKGSNGMLELNGKPFRLTFMTTAGNKTRENVQTFVKDQLAQIGVDVVIQNQPAKVFFGETMTKRRFEGLAMYAWVSSPESDPGQNYHSASVPSESNGWSGANYSGWKNLLVDQAIDALNRSFELKDRAAHSKVIQSAYTRELPALPLYYRAQILVQSSRLKGVIPTATTFSEAYGAEHWTLD